MAAQKTSPQQAPVGLQHFNENELVASICRDSFYHFVQEFWSTVVPEKPTWNWHIEFLCNELQVAAERVFRGEPKLYDLIINVPPGSTKSTVVSIMFPAWTWTRMPSARHIGGSFAQTLSHDLGRRAKDVATSDKYKACFPEVMMRQDQNAKSYFMNTAGGSVRRTTVGSVIVGEHAHFHQIDDPLDPEGARSDADLARANTWCTETIAQRKVNQKIAFMVLVMQRLHQNDPTGYILDKSAKGVWKTRHICLPAVRTKAVSPKKVRTLYGKDGLFDPVRLPHDVLEEKKDLGQYMYSGQYLQNPVPLGGGMFKVDRLVMDAPPPMNEFTTLVRYWDKAATAGGGAYTAGVLLGVRMVADGGKGLPQYWVLHAVRDQLDTDARERLIDMTASRDPKRAVIGIEDEGGSTGKDVALTTVRRHAGRRLIMHRPSGDKVLRADPVSVQVNGHNLRIAKYGDARDEWIPAFVDELQHFPFGKYKDQVDALSGAFALCWKRKRAGGMWG